MYSYISSQKAKYTHRTDEYIMISANLIKANV